MLRSTWQKGLAVASHPNLARLPRVRIRNRESTFWRYQELGNQFLATIEAIYYCCADFYSRLQQQKADKLAHASGNPTGERKRAPPQPRYADSRAELASSSSSTTGNGVSKSTSIADRADLKSGASSAAAESSSAGAACGYEATRHFDDLLLLYAASYDRIVRRYGTENSDGRKPPKSWDPAAHAEPVLRGELHGAKFGQNKFRSNHAADSAPSKSSSDSP